MVHQVQDLSARIAELKKKGVYLRNEIEVGPGGRQIQVEDPDGNSIELFEPGSDTFFPVVISNIDPCIGQVTILS